MLGWVEDILIPDDKTTEKRRKPHKWNASLLSSVVVIEWKKNQQQYADPDRNVTFAISQEIAEHIYEHVKKKNELSRTEFT